MIQIDIEKTYVKGHRIPVDDELANILAVARDYLIIRTGQDNSIVSRIFYELDHFIKYVIITLSERYANLICKGD
ncbi:hypothetical protein KHA96_20540 [Bacillus sp. FJAT-49711]|uniref:hypothetical protein n=1 Tax=Bacillus sp. FJAT-49711 TaxID=2833585 RepID=UPI001BCA4313|nr:hypothetical protein [Bacillus sp. FJAT-49711]